MLRGDLILNVCVGVCLNPGMGLCMCVRVCGRFCLGCVARSLHVCVCVHCAIERVACACACVVFCVSASGVCVCVVVVCPRSLCRTRWVDDGGLLA